MTTPSDGASESDVSAAERSTDKVLYWQRLAERRASDNRALVEAAVSLRTRAEAANLRMVAAELTQALVAENRGSEASR